MNLQMSNTQINLVDDLFRPILLSLKSLQALKMQCCKVGSIPPDTLWRMSRLRELDLTSNRINSFTLSKALKNVTQIQRLNLRGNNINTVNESTIPLEVRQSVKIMDLSGNPYDCTCKLLWFKSWVEEEQKYGNVSFGNWPRQYVCNTPAKWKHTRVSDYNPSYRDCHPVNIFIVVGGAGGSFVFLLISTVSLVYRYRWYLRYYIYRLRRRRQYKYERLRNEEDEPIEYSIYLAYSEQDLEWVMTEMLPFLETQAQQKVFLKNRDIKGGTVADNIVLNMDRSERVLLVLTDAYTREGWSGYEFQHVLYACIEQSKDVIVVLKGDLEAGRMTKYMRRMLTKGTFLQWDDSEQARSAFKDGLMVALGTGGNMQAVC
nr:hypothetical protein BaRGS_013339 [Batillaria attramentaria]